MKTRYFVLTVGDMPDIAEFNYIDIMDIRKGGKNKKDTVRFIDFKILRGKNGLERLRYLGELTGLLPKKDLW